LNPPTYLVGGLPQQSLFCSRWRDFCYQPCKPEDGAKTGSLGFGILAAISAPTAAAINLAEKIGITLVGFVRGDHYVVYTHPQFLNGLNKQL
jgi:FdhD/NarQ family